MVSDHRYCDRKKLGIRESTEVVHGQVCEGVQHAHQKPSSSRPENHRNSGGGSGRPPVPRIIDFGLAKAIVPARAGGTCTHSRRISGPPGYMSPEQVDFPCPRLDTRPHVYILGVIFTSCWTGFCPLRPNAGRSCPDEFMRSRASRTRRARTRVS